MAIAEVRKIHLLAHRAEVDDVVDFLQAEGVVEVAAASTGAERERAAGTDEEIRSALRRLDQALGLLKPYMEKETLREKIYTSKPLMTRGEVDRIAASFDLEGFLATCEGKAGEIATLEGEIAQGRDEQRALLPWSRLDAPPAMLRRTRRVEVMAGRFPAAARDRLAGGPGDPETALEIAAEDERWIHGVLFCHGDGAASLRERMKEAGFTEAALPELECTPAERIARLDEECRQKRGMLAELRTSHRRMAGSRKELLVMRDVIGHRLERLRSEGLMGGTARTVSIEGWAAARDLPGLRRSLAERFDLADIEDFEPDPRERIPVILDNAPVVRPFGLVVDLYGLPRYGAVDPSAVMAGFFALFFGLCLTDAGYGIFLAVTTGMLLYLAPPNIPAGRKRFFQMFFLCGLASIAAGAAAGGWFGVAAPWRLFDPLENLKFFFLLALAAGTLHLFAGLALRMGRLIRAGDLFGALVDHGLWISLVLALYGIAAGKGGFVPASLAKAFEVAAIASALGIVFFQGRPAGEQRAGWVRHLPWSGATLAGTLWFAGAARPWSAAACVLFLAAAPLVPGVSLGRALGRIGLGLYSLYGIAGYLSDVLSYSRLVALGLGTGIVALVVNKMAVVAQGMPAVGMFMSAAVFVGGHLFNILINLLGAFVHSCRLQYVEFFTKFYESGGKPFSPFRLETRYITITEQT